MKIKTLFALVLSLIFTLESYAESIVHQVTCEAVKEDGWVGPQRVSLEFSFSRMPGYCHGVSAFAPIPTTCETSPSHLIIKEGFGEQSKIFFEGDGLVSSRSRDHFQPVENDLQLVFSSVDPVVNIQIERASKPILSGNGGIYIEQKEGIFYAEFIEKCRYTIVGSPH